MVPGRVRPLPRRVISDRTPVDDFCFVFLSRLASLSIQQEKIHHLLGVVSEISSMMKFYISFKIHRVDKSSLMSFCLSLKHPRLFM